MKNQLKKTIREFIEIDEKNLDDLMGIFKLVTFPKRTTLLNEGQIPRNAYFILEGSIRFFYKSNGKEITGNIFTENMFATSHDGFLLQTSSKYSIETIETIEKCKVFEFSYSNLSLKIEQFPIINKLIYEVLVKRLTLAHTTISRLIVLTPEERYLCILKENPEWIQRLPHYIIASYLGISPTSLSRIRKRSLK